MHTNQSESIELESTLEPLTSPSDPPEEQLDLEPEPDPVAELTSFVAVLRNRNFLALWSGQVFSQLADKMFLVLMILLISIHFQQPGQSISRWVSSIMIASTLPAILFGTVAGVYVDRWAKKPVMVGSNLLRGGLVLAIPVLIWASQGRVFANWIPLGFALLLVVTFVVSTLTQYFAPAEQSTIPLIVPKADLLPANSLYTTTMMGSLIVGFAIGEPLLAAADALTKQLFPGIELGPEVIVGGSYLLAGLILLLLRTGEADRVQSGDSEVWQDIQIGIRYLRETPMVRAALVQIVVLYSIFAALTVLAVRMAELIPGLKASQFGFLLAAAGLGMGIGAFWVGHAGHHVSRRRLALIGSVGLGGSLMALAWTTHLLVPSLILIAVLGVSGALVGVPMQTVIQEETPEDLRGKVFGLENNLTNIALSLPLVLAGVAETYLGLLPVLLGLGVLTIFSGFLTWGMAAPLLEEAPTDPKSADL